jgi:NAD(P)-dependent dehydrogenase (short-subunit alcohol dehydrogenase family)
VTGAGEPADRRALVTGAAKGLGRAIVSGLAAQGWDVAVLDPDEQARAVVAEIEQAGRRGTWVACDVSDPDAVRGAFAEVAASFGVPSLLVNNAGVYPRAQPEALTYEQWSQAISVNLGGAFLCAQAFRSHLGAGDPGGIVNIGSTVAFKGSVDGAAYVSSKAGLVGLTRSLALAWAPDIRVNLVAPGMADTDQSRAAGRSPEETQAFVDRIPLRRMCTGEDVANAVCFLASDASAYITGQVLNVNGGSVLY